MAKNAHAGKPAIPQAAPTGRKLEEPATHTPEPAVARSPAAVEGGGAQAEPVLTHLLVTSRRAGFRRAGRPWSTTPTLVPLDEFTPGQILDLFAEPMFETVGLTAEAAGSVAMDLALRQGA